MMRMYAVARARLTSVSVVLCLSLQVCSAVSAADGGLRDPPAPVGTIEFVGKNLVATANGSFTSWKFTKFDVDADAIAESEVVVEVDVSSVDTGSKMRDEHLREPDFFDVARFPTASVRVFGARLIDGSASRYTAQFEVTIRDVTKTLEGEIDLESGNPSRVKGRIVIDRTEFGVGEPYSRWNPLAIKERIPVEFSAEVGR